MVEINRPEVRNCVNHGTAAELHRAFMMFEETEECGVAVLSGRGGHFCAGYDLKELAGTSVASILGKYGLGPAPMGPTHLTRLSKPVIAAVSGYAVAGGLELALMCDMRVVEETATFGVFCRRFGVPLMDGGTVRLHQLIGLSRAMDMILTGRPVDAKEAYSFGLANRIVQHGKSLSEAKLLARQLLSFPQLCLRQDRRSAYDSAYSGLTQEDHLRKEFEEAKSVLEKESVQGAERFSSGEGRGGKFNL
jgi:enoyl-CoA hydratase/carnithine racemase